MFEKLKNKVSSIVSKVVGFANEVKGKADVILTSPYEYIHQCVEQMVEGTVLAKVPGASHFVEILVAIIIVIALGVTFKTQIAAFITSITKQATTNASGLF